MSYLAEFRRRLIYCLIMLGLIFTGLFCFCNHIYDLIALPLLKQLPLGQKLIAINILSPVFVPVQLVFVIALFLAMPFFLYQLWVFIAPALYLRERKLLWPLLALSMSLFYLGVSFAYFIILPILFKFLTHSAPVGVVVSPDMSQYLDFVLNFFFIFGIIFEIPIITVLVIYSEIISRKKLIKMRPYAIVFAFIIGMLLAPPDVMSQILVAIPLWLLFEIGLFLSPFFVRMQDDKKK